MLWARESQTRRLRRRERMGSLAVGQRILLESLQVALRQRKIVVDNPNGWVYGGGMKTKFEAGHEVVKVLPAYWASYLINGDDSGLEPGEKAVVDKFLADQCLPKPVSCTDEQYFKWGNDATRLGGDVLEYTFFL